jgi:peptidyl-prolyl cis-trans isomerase-like 4
MSVLIETSRGDLVVDLFCDDAPVAARNFLRLCR